MNNENLHLRIATPSRTFYNDYITSISFKSSDGMMTFMKNHVPLMTLADIGIMKITDLDNNVKDATLFGGSVLIENNKIVIITDDALWPEEIDVKRAEAAKARAEARMNDMFNAKQDKERFIKAELALKRALVRINLANTYEGISRRGKNY